MERCEPLLLDPDPWVPRLLHSDSQHLAGGREAALDISIRARDMKSASRPKRRFIRFHSA